MSNTFETTNVPGSPPEGELDTFASATRLLEALRTRKISSIELLKMFLKQIERFNPALKAIVYPDFGEARKWAEEADAARARGEEKPLLGLPFTLKDTIMAEGLPNTMGVTAFANFRSPRMDFWPDELKRRVEF